MCVVKAGARVKAQHGDGHQDVHELMGVEPVVQHARGPGLDMRLQPPLRQAQHIDHRPSDRADLQCVHFSRDSDCSGGNLAGDRSATRALALQSHPVEWINPMHGVVLTR